MKISKYTNVNTTSLDDVEISEINIFQAATDFTKKINEHRYARY